MQGSDFILGDEFRIDNSETPVRLEQAAGTLSTNERCLLFKLARDHYLGSGHMIDAGSFLGSSSLSLAEGLKANSLFRTIADRIASPIVAYEIGMLPAPPGAKTAITRHFGKYKYTLGESFVPILKENIAGHEDVIDLHIGDFLTETWPAEKPIEICFIDLARTNDLNVRCFQQLFPAFLPGRTLLVQQDFFFDRAPWIKVLMGYLEEHFEWLGQVGPSSLYRYRSQIPEEKYAIDPYTDIPAEQRIAYHQTAYHPGLSPRRQLPIALSHCYLLEACGGPREAMEELQTVRARFADLVSRLPNLRIRLDRAEAQFAKAVQPTKAAATKRAAVAATPSATTPDFSARSEAKRRVTQAIRDLTQAGNLMAHERQLDELYSQWTGLPWPGPENDRLRSEFAGARRAALRKLNEEKRAAGLQAPMRRPGGVRASSPRDLPPPSANPKTVGASGWISRLVARARRWLPSA